MPVRQLSNASSAASATSSRETTTSTVRTLTTAGDISPGGVSPPAPPTSDFDIRSVRYEASFGHQALVELVVLFQEIQHLLAGKEDRLERLLLHVVLLFGRLRQLLEQIDVQGGLLSGDLARQEHGAPHQVLHVDALLLAGRDFGPRFLVRDLGLVLDALLVEHAERADLVGAPDFQGFRL